MADVKKININSTDYDIADAKALRTKDTVGTGSFIDTRAGTTQYPTTEAHTESIILGKEAHVRGGSARAGLTVLGNGAYANMSYATVIGNMAHANGSQTVSIGYAANAGGNQAVAIGNNASANSVLGIAIGSGASINSGSYSIIIGTGSGLSGQSSIVMGYATSVASDYSMAFGRSATVGSGSTYSVAVGYNATVSNYCSYSLALGYNARATSTYTAQIGEGTNSSYGTLQFRSWQLVRSDGKIPEERLPDSIKTATPMFPNLYDINEDKVSEQSILYTGETNDSYKNSQFYRGRVRYGYPRFYCGWVDSDWLDSQNDVMIDQQKFFTKLAEVTKQRIDDDDIENGVMGGDNSEMSIYLKYDADNDYYFLDFDSDSFEKAFNGQSDDITGLSFEDLADYGIYFRNFHKPSDLEGEYEFCDIYYYAPVYIDSYDWNNNPSYIDYFKFLNNMNDGDWGIGYVIPNYDYWEFEVDGTNYICPIIPKTYEWNGDEYDGIDFRWEWQDGSWYQYINGEDIARDWTTAEMYTTFGIKIEPGEEENIEYINFYVRGGEQRHWEQFDPVNIENFATAEQLEDLSGEVNALKNWSVQVVTGGKDLNNYTTEGVYQFVGSPITNKPSTVDTHFIMLVQVYSSVVKQIIFAAKVNSVVGTTALTSYAPTMFHRVRNSGTWTSWQTVLSGDWANYVTGFDRTKQQKLIHLDNSNGDATSAVPRWVADTGGGSSDIDNLTITTNADDEIQAVAVIDQNTGIAKTWTGTMAEYEAIVTKDPETEYIITDDIGGSATEIGEITEDINDLKEHTVIEFQAPTAANNYTWYRKYRDGWVEQGGKATTTSVSLPITMADTNYQVSMTQIGSSSAYAAEPANLSTTGFTYWQYQNVYNAYWQVSGMAA